MGRGARPHHPLAGQKIRPGQRHPGRLGPRPIAGGEAESREACGARQGTAGTAETTGAQESGVEHCLGAVSLDRPLLVAFETSRSTPFYTNREGPNSVLRSVDYTPIGQCDARSEDAPFFSRRPAGRFARRRHRLSPRCARANFLSGKGVMRACSAAHWEEYFVVCESVWASWGGRRRLGRQPRTDRRPAITTKKWSCALRRVA